MAQEQEMKLRKVDFTKSLRGYSCEEVDTYLAYANDRYSKLWKECSDLRRKMAAMAAAQNEYREDALREKEQLLEESEALREQNQDMLENARHKAAQILAEAEAAAAKILRQAEEQDRARIASLRETIRREEEEARADSIRRITERNDAAERLIQEMDSFRTTMLEAYGKHLEELDRLAELTDRFYQAKEELTVDMGTEESENLPEPAALEVPLAGEEVPAEEALDETADTDTADTYEEEAETKELRIDWGRFHGQAAAAAAVVDPIDSLFTTPAESAEEFEEAEELFDTTEDSAYMPADLPEDLPAYMPEEPTETPAGTYEDFEEAEELFDTTEDAADLPEEPTETPADTYEDFEEAEELFDTTEDAAYMPAYMPEEPTETPAGTYEDFEEAEELFDTPEDAADLPAYMPEDLPADFEEMPEESPTDLSEDISETSTEDLISALWKTVQTPLAPKQEAPSAQLTEENSLDDFLADIFRTLPEEEEKAQAAEEQEIEDGDTYEEEMEESEDAVEEDTLSDFMDDTSEDIPALRNLPSAKEKPENDFGDDDQDISLTGEFERIYNASKSAANVAQIDKQPLIGASKPEKPNKHSKL